MLNKNITISSGQIITIILDNENFESITFYDKNHKKIGLFEFRILNDYSSNYKLIYMNLDTKYTRLGLGETALCFFKSSTGANIYTSPDDGKTKQDGSHLTGDAPIFVSKMKQKGIISGDYN
jgi:hypothetical protein